MTLLHPRLLARMEATTGWTVNVFDDGRALQVGELERQYVVRRSDDGIIRVEVTNRGVSRHLFASNSQEAVDSFFLLQLSRFVTRRYLFDLPDGVEVEKTDAGFRVGWGDGQWADFEGFAHSTFMDAFRFAQLAPFPFEELEASYDSPEGGEHFVSFEEYQERYRGRSGELQIVDFDTYTQWKEEKHG